MKSFYNKKEIRVSRESLIKPSGLKYSEELSSSKNSTEREDFMKLDDNYSLKSFKLIESIKRKQSKLEIRKIKTKP